MVRYQNLYNKQIVFQSFSVKKNVFFNSMEVLGFIYELVTVKNARVIKMKKLPIQGALILKL